MAQTGTTSDLKALSTIVPKGAAEAAPVSRARSRNPLVGPRTEKTVALALQGGGAHGAFTWGVLDALIEDGRLGFDAVTGASAGAMNAVVLIDGWLAGGPEGAREALATFWRHASVDGDLWPVQRGMVSGVVGAFKDNPFAEFWMKVLAPSPYVSNPLNINPLRRALEQTVDFERLRSAETADVFVSATNVWTGKLTVFERASLTADHLMASACLPTVFQAVEIDGVPYWDGGYLGNPALYPLHQHIGEGRCARDILIVQINPVERRETPRTPQEIQNRLNEITFNANLMRELRAIDVMHDVLAGQEPDGATDKRVFIHRIDGTEALDDYDASSRLDARWRGLERLRDRGREAAQHWLAERFDGVGRESTLDLRSAYQ